jgi:teichuronic acid biosynthesis glycosyltransferase TuaG
MCRITFITPTLNRDPRIVERCIRSVALQTLRDWEQVVCSDGRHEPLIERLVERRGDPRQRYTYLPRCVGHYGAGVREAMIDAARGEYLAFLDDDNIVFPKFGETMIEALDRNASAGFAICQIVQCGSPPDSPTLAPYVINGIPPVLKNIDTLQVVVRKDAMCKTRWCLDGYMSDGRTYEKLAREHRWIGVDSVLGMRL